MKRSGWSSAFFTLAFCSLLSPSLTRAATTRVEENDSRITYSGNWYANASALNSGGSAALTNSLGSKASITFDGTGISWLGVADPWSGLARVYVDGVMSIIDSYAGTTAYQSVIFTARGLTPGTHTLTIEVMHARDANGSGSWVWVDGFDIEDGIGPSGGVSAPAGRTEQDGKGVNFNGGWFLNTNGVQSGGTAALSTEFGSRANLTFNGTGAKWITYRDAWSGIANVYIDGALKATVDNYAPIDQARMEGYSIDGLSPGVHVLTIEVTGTHGTASKGSWVWVDAFDVTGQ